MRRAVFHAGWEVRGRRCRTAEFGTIGGWVRRVLMLDLTWLLSTISGASRRFGAVVEM